MVSFALLIQTLIAVHTGKAKEHTSDQRTGKQGSAGNEKNNIMRRGKVLAQHAVHPATDCSLEEYQD